MIQFTCSACGTQMQVADEHAGRKAKCTGCGTVVPIPAAPAEFLEPAQPVMTPPTQGNLMPPGPVDRTGLAMKAIGIGATAVVLIGLAAVLLWPGGGDGGDDANGKQKHGLLWRQREEARRTVCSSNLHQISTALTVYSYSNHDRYPIGLYGLYPEPESDRIGGVDYTQAIGSYRGKRGEQPKMGGPEALRISPAKLSTVRSLWALSRYMLGKPEMFICPSTDDEPNDEDDLKGYSDFGKGDIPGPVSVEQAAEFWRQISYGYQVPYGRMASPRSRLDPRLVVAGDKGPYGAAIDAGHDMPPALSVTAEAKPEDWAPWNSPNHGGSGEGEGQSVVHIDGQVGWFNTPLAGADGDNVYTQTITEKPDRLALAAGKPPTPGGRETPAASTDSLIYP